MSDTDSFIDEVTEEVRRDRLFALFRRYGWIAGLVVVLIVGGAAWNEYRKAQAARAAQSLGDALIAALEQDAPESRVSALARIDAGTPLGTAVVEFTLANAQVAAGEVDAAIGVLERIAVNGDLPEIYRQIAAFKALGLQSGESTAQTRREGYEALARPGAPLRLLAEEQLAMIEVETGATEAAIARLQGIIDDAETTRSLTERAVQAITALGGTPEPGSGQQG